MAKSMEITPSAGSTWIGTTTSPPGETPTIAGRLTLLFPEQVNGVETPDRDGRAASTTLLQIATRRANSANNLMDFISTLPDLSGVLYGLHARPTAGLPYED